MEAVISTRALCLYLLIVAAWRRAVLCAVTEAVEQSLANDSEGIDRNGNTVGFTYNNMNKASQISHPAPLNSNSASSTVISYTLRGDMSYYTSPEVNKEFAYDALRRKTLEGQYMPLWPTAPPGGMLYAEFEYDKKNRMTYTRDFSGMETVTVYDDVYQTKTVTDVTNSQTTNIGYDPAGNMTTKTSPNGLTDNYTYDNDNRLSYQEIRDSNNALMGNKAYTYNNNSQINWDSASGYFGNYYTDYTYNSQNLISTEVRTGNNSYNKSYGYDGMNNRTTKTENGVNTTYSYNGLGRITQSQSNGITTNYTYDSNGNLRIKNDGTNTENYKYDWKNNMVRYKDTNGNKEVYYGYDIGNVKIVKAWEASDEEQMSSMSGARPGAYTPRIVAQVSGMRTLDNALSSASYNTCADIVGRKFFYHKLQMSNVCDACTDILDTSSWDNDSSWIWEQAFFNDFSSGMSLTEYEETTARKTGVGPYTVHYDGWGSMAVQTTGNAGTWQMLECDAVGVVTASQAIVGSSLIGARGAWNDYFDWYGNEYRSGLAMFDAMNETIINNRPKVNCDMLYSHSASYARVVNGSGICYHVIIAIFDYLSFDNHWNAIKAWEKTRLQCKSCKNDDASKLHLIRIFIGFPTGPDVPKAFLDAAEKSKKQAGSACRGTTQVVNQNGSECRVISADSSKFLDSNGNVTDSQRQKIVCKELFHAACNVASHNSRGNKACTFRLLGHGSDMNNGSQLIGSGFSMDMSEAVNEITKSGVVNANTKFSTTVCYGYQIAEGVTINTGAESIGPNGNAGYESFKKDNNTVVRSTPGPKTGDELNANW